MLPHLFLLLRGEIGITGESLSNLAVLFYNEGKLTEAGGLMRRAYTIQEAVLGPQHPDTQQSRNVLARIEQRLRKQSRPWWQIW
jgi:hypothetical protein